MTLFPPAPAVVPAGVLDRALRALVATADRPLADAHAAVCRAVEDYDGPRPEVIEGPKGRRLYWPAGRAW